MLTNSPVIVCLYMTIIQLIGSNLGRLCTTTHLRTLEVLILVVIVLDSSDPPHRISSTHNHACTQSRDAPTLRRGLSMRAQALNTRRPSMHAGSRRHHWALCATIIGSLAQLSGVSTQLSGALGATITALGATIRGLDAASRPFPFRRSLASGHLLDELVDVELLLLLLLLLPAL
eukprot:878279-Prorocentrum_minimum.AAC.1